jgi:hypothetical protein
LAIGDAVGAHESVSGTNRTSSDVRYSVAIGGKTGHGADSPIRSSQCCSLFTSFWEGGDQYNGRSIANLDAAVYPAVAVPVAFANEPAHGLFDIYRRGRIVDRRRGSRA